MRSNRRKFIANGALAAVFASSVAALSAGGEPAQDKPAAAAQDADLQKARAQSINNLKMIGLGMHNFASTTGTLSLPPAVINSKDGKPLLSWRVALLPHLDQQALYEKFHLDEPWDSPHNKALLEQIPAVYRPVVQKNEPKGSTYYQVFHGPGTLFDGDEGTRFPAVTDGTTNTVAVVEAGTPVPWTKPDDITFVDDKPLPKLGGQFADGFHAVFADGSAFFIARTIDEHLLRALVTRSGGEVVDRDAIPRVD